VRMVFINTLNVALFWFRTVRQKSNGPARHG
jgi:hypothetical protein